MLPKNVKVVLKQTELHGSNPGVIEEIARVYMDGRELRVSAPPEAIGNPLGWFDHWDVRTGAGDGFGGDVAVTGDFGLACKMWVLEELEKRRRAVGMHPDGLHCNAQICANGHVIHCDGAPLDETAYCTKCGSPCIDECAACKVPIRGVERHQRAATFVLPLYCHACGKPYPWMEERLRTARELLSHAEKLSSDDRDKLFDLLQYVMSNPKSDLTPAKTRLIDFFLERAPAVREFVLDLMAKAGVELLKSQS